MMIAADSHSLSGASQPVDREVESFCFISCLVLLPDLMKESFQENRLGCLYQVLSAKTTLRLKSWSLLVENSSSGGVAHPAGLEPATF
jgi:hypothetical protein